MVDAYIIVLAFFLGFAMGLYFKDSMNFVVSRVKYIHDQSKRQGR